MRGIWLVACWLVVDAARAGETIFRCTGADGEPSYTDGACPSGPPQTTLDIDADDVNALDMALPDVAVTRRSTVHRSTARETRVAATRGDDAERRCDTAQQKLAAIRALMRHGYKASAAGRIDARWRAARDRVERACAR
jgi:hypothetical protein